MLDTQLLHMLCGICLTKRKLILENNREALMRLMMDATIMNIYVILLAAANTTAMAERYGSGYRFDSIVVSVSMPLSVVTVSSIAWFIQMI